MDGRMDGYKGKVWLCSRGGHALGLVLRDEMRGVYANRMVLFRHAFDLSSAEKDEDGVVVFSDAKKKAILEGKAEGIECELCDHQRTWEMDERLAVYLLGPLFGQKVKRELGV